jgi:hypothetical protein
MNYNKENNLYQKFYPPLPVSSCNSLPVAKEQICGSSIRPPQGIEKFRSLEFPPLEEDSIVGVCLISYRRMKKTINSNIIINDEELKKGETSWYPDVKIWRERKDNGIDLKGHVLSLEITIQGNVWTSTPFILHSNQTQLINRSNLRINYKKQKKNKISKSSKKSNNKKIHKDALDEILHYIKMKNKNEIDRDKFHNPIKLLLVDEYNDLFKEILAIDLSRWNGLLYTTDRLFFNVDVSHVLFSGKNINSHFFEMLVHNNPKVVTGSWLKIYINTGSISNGLISFCDYKWKILISSPNVITFPENFEVVYSYIEANFVII